MNKQEQIRQLKETIEEAKRQVEELEREPEESKIKLKSGMVVRGETDWNTYIWLVREVTGGLFLFDLEVDHQRWSSQPRTSEQLLRELKRVEVLFDSLEEYYREKFKKECEKTTLYNLHTEKSKTWYLL